MKSNFPGGSPSDHVAYILKISEKFFKVLKHMEADAKNYCDSDETLGELLKKRRAFEDQQTMSQIDLTKQTMREQKSNAASTFCFFYKRLEMLLLEISLFYKRPVSSAHSGFDYSGFGSAHSFHKNLLSALRSFHRDLQHPVTRYLPMSSITLLDTWRQVRNAIKSEGELDDVQSLLLDFSSDSKIISQAIKELMNEMDISARVVQDVTSSEEISSSEPKHTESEMQTTMTGPATPTLNAVKNLADALAQIDISATPKATSSTAKTSTSANSTSPEDLSGDFALNCASALETEFDVDIVSQAHSNNVTQREGLH